MAFNLFSVIIGFFLLVGYLIVFISVVTQKPVVVRDDTRIGVLEAEILRLKALNNANPNSNIASVIPTQVSTKKSNRFCYGVIILGMHRSGTSVVGGLLNKMGLNTGGPLIGPASDNAKGFFERIDVVLQNDYLMKKQQLHYAFATHKYDAIVGLKHILNDDGKFFIEGQKGLDFLNNEKNYPWMLKDPRLCITLRTWIPLLNFIPAILFTYRHPLDVALSMHKREFEQFTIQKGLKMWYVYNRRAVLQSNDLCRVVASHRRIMSSPKQEFDRIFDELKECGLNIPHKLTLTDIGSFIDMKLQHGSQTLQDTSCKQRDFDSLNPPANTWDTSDPVHLKLYRQSMKAYCALEDRSAFSRDFSWDMTIKDV